MLMEKNFIANNQTFLILLVVCIVDMEELIAVIFLDLEEFFFQSFASSWGYLVINIYKCSKALEEHAGSPELGFQFQELENFGKYFL